MHAISFLISDPGLNFFYALGLMSVGIHVFLYALVFELEFTVFGCLMVLLYIIPIHLFQIIDIAHIFYCREFLFDV